MLTFPNPAPNRMVASSLADMESRYNKAIERTALLEEELVDKSKLEEENQRLKDELRGEHEHRFSAPFTALRRTDSKLRGDQT